MAKKRAESFRRKEKAMASWTPNEGDKMHQHQKKVNRKFRVPRKQGAHFLGARAQIQDSSVFSSSV
jgi:hypothetical protein